MTEYKSFMTPIEPKPKPPKHTEIQPKCFLCKHFPICDLRTDYLKTAQLIENVLGNPNDSYELFPLPIPFPDFKGTVIENFKDYFPAEVKSEVGNVAKFYGAKYESSKTINFIYSYCGCFFFFVATYNSETETFDITKGKEIFYNMEYVIASPLDDLQLGLLALKEDIEEEEKEEKPEKDVINTTYFSAALNCQFYEWEKGLDYESGLKRMIAEYPDGIPLDKDGRLYHLATYHIEPKKVIPYMPKSQQPAFYPMPYPVYIPPKACPPPKTRDELNEF